MKRILITGAGSFVGSSVKRYLQLWPDQYFVTEIGTKEGEWRRTDFSDFDVVYHVAGLAHSDTGHITETKKKYYYEINTDLAVDVAKKAKEAGVRQFIFMSSSTVYGDSAPIGISKMITRETPCKPTNVYGDSKLKAENRILPFSDANFKVAILRCPMIYGKGGKGNFPILEKIALRIPFFPKVKNVRSMLYIGNLAEFVRLIIDKEENGIFWPCNKEWSNTSELVQLIAGCHGRKTVLVPCCDWLLKFTAHFTGNVNKAFGSLAYEEHLGDYKEDYRLFSLRQSIEETEKQ